MLKYRFICITLTFIMCLSAALPSFAFFYVKEDYTADMGIINQQQMKKKESDISLLETQLFINSAEKMINNNENENAVKITLTLNNNSFMPLKDGQDVGGWVINSPSEIKATVCNDIDRGAQSAVIMICGTVSEDHNEPIAIGIPNSALAKNSMTTVKSQINQAVTWQVLNDNYKYDDEIDEKDAEDDSEMEEISASEEENGEVIASENSDYIMSIVKSALDTGYNPGSLEINFENCSYISPEIIENIYNYIKENNNSIRLSAINLVFDQKGEKRAVNSRIYVGLQKLYDEGNGIDPSVIYDQNDSEIEEIKSQFEKRYGKDGTVIYLKNTGNFGARAGISVFVEGKISEIKNKKLYSYDNSDNTFSEFKNSNYVDNSGYLHFFAENGGFFVLA